jgi:hypothetical protein
MAAKLTRLTHKITIQLHLVAEIPFAVLALGGQSGNFWLHSRVSYKRAYYFDIFNVDMILQFYRLVSKS